MKKMNLYLWLITLVGLFAACSQDDAAGPQNNESNRVSLTASLPADFATIGTRALPSAPNGYKLRCILEVWTRDNNPVLKHREEKAELSGDNVQFDFTIDEGTYDCLFWADYIGSDATATSSHYPDKYYKTNDGTNGLKAIEIITDSYAFNTDARDAFFGSYELTKGAAAVENQSIPALTRPFAKLTIKEKSADNYAKCTGLTATYKVPQKFNVLTGAVDATAEPLEVTCREKATADQTLFSDYIFTDATSTLDEITMTFTNNNNSEKPLRDVTIPAGIPLKRNYKTIASGTLVTEVTKEVQLTVTMNNDWKTQDVEEDLDTRWDGTYPTSNEEALEWMGTSTGQTPTTYTITTAKQLAGMAYYCSQAVREETFELSTDIDLADHPWRPIGRVSGTGTVGFKGIFNGNGHTIKRMNITPESAHLYSGFIANCTGTVKNLIVEGKVGSSGNNNSQWVCGGIVGSAMGLYSNGNIIACGFRGTIDCNVTTSNSVYVGGIAGINEGGNITACISWATSVTTTGESENYSGGIAGFLKKCTTYGNTEATAKGNYWYYSGSEGISQGFGRSSDSPTTANNNSFSNNSAINSALATINSYLTGNDYIWQAGSDGYPILVKQTAATAN